MARVRHPRLHLLEAAEELEPGIRHRVDGNRERPPRDARYLHGRQPVLGGHDRRARGNVAALLHHLAAERHLGERAAAGQQLLTRRAPRRAGVQRAGRCGKRAAEDQVRALAQVAVDRRAAVALDAR